MGAKIARDWKMLVPASDEVNVPYGLLAAMCADGQLQAEKDGRFWLVHMPSLLIFAEQYHEQERQRKLAAETPAAKISSDWDYPTSLRLRGILKGDVQRIENQLTDPYRVGRYPTQSEYDHWASGARGALAYKHEELGNLEYQIAQYEAAHPEQAISGLRQLTETQGMLVECQNQARRFAARLRAAGIDPDTV